MKDGHRGGNTQLIVVGVLIVVAAIGWFVIRRHDATAIAARDASSCWTATCRDAVLRGNYDDTAYERTVNAL